MPEKRLVIVYVGDAATQQWLTTSLKSAVICHAETFEQALGIYVSRRPDLVILDTRSRGELARQLFFHLRTIDAEPIIVLDPSADDLEYPADARVRVLCTTGNLLTHITELTTRENGYVEESSLESSLNWNWN